MCFLNVSSHVVKVFYINFSKVTLLTLDLTHWADYMLCPFFEQSIMVSIDGGYLLNIYFSEGLGIIILISFILWLFRFIVQAVIVLAKSWVFWVAVVANPQ